MVVTDMSSDHAPLPEPTEPVESVPVGSALPPYAPPAGYTVLPAEPPARRSSSWLPALAVVAVLAVLATAFLLVRGGSPGGSVADAATVVHDASAKAAQVGTSSVDMQIDMTVAGQDVHATGSGAFDYRKRLGRFSIEMPQFGSMQEVVTPRALYMRMPDSMTGMLGTGDRPWLKISFSAFKRAGLDMSKLMNANPTADPSSLLRSLEAATDIKRVGTETVRGVETTHYSAVGTMADMVRAEGATSAVDLSKLPAGFADTELHSDVWIDGDGLPRQLRVAMDLPDLGSMTMTMNFYGFGDPVSVVVPPKAVVTDITKLAASAQR
jgi:hypothetical protein